MAWLLAAFIAIVTAPGQVRDLTEIGPIRCEQCDTCLTHKKVTPPASLPTN